MQPDQGVCKSCGAPLLWCRTRNQKLMPVDAEPHPEGTIDISSGEAVVVKRIGVVPLFGLTLHRPHHQTCPNVSEHRKKGGAS